MKISEIINCQKNKEYNSFLIGEIIVFFSADSNEIMKNDDLEPQAVKNIMKITLSLAQWKLENRSVIMPP